jgi:hypothetical protein
MAPWIPARLVAVAIARDVAVWSVQGAILAIMAWMITRLL